MTHSSPILMVEDIHKSFADQEVLKGISLSAKQGDVISILGSSGSGKSTFLRCLNFLEVADKGRIQIGSQEIQLQGKEQKTNKKHKVNKFSRQERKQIESMRTQLGMVFQGFNLWTHKTALENVIEGPVQVLKRPHAEVEREAMEYLAKVGMAEKAQSYPEQLSGGQKQRVAIARALAMQPQVLLFDEPTSALDPELVGEVLKVVKDLAAEKRTMIVVTHEMGFAREISDHILFLHEGRIEDQGSPEYLFENSSSQRVREFFSSVI